MTQETGADFEIGLVATLRLLSDDRMRIVLDDLTLESDKEKTLVKIRGLYTHLNFEATSPEEIPLTKDELAAIGETILTRLLILRESRERWFAIAKNMPVKPYGELEQS